MRTSLSIKDWVEGLKSPGGALAKSGDSKSEAAGHAALGALEGVGVGVGLGIAGGLLPGGLSPKAIGLASLLPLAGSVAFASKPLGRHLSNVTVAMAAIAAYEHGQNKTAHVAGTTSAVLTNKAKAIAAHGDDADESLNAGEDPLVAAGARIFGS